MNWTLAEIIEASEIDIRFEGNADLLQQRVAAVTIDSRQVGPNHLFIAIKGDRFDGHDFLKDVFESKALAVVVEQDSWPKINDLPGSSAFLLVPDTLRALQEIAAAFARKINPKIVALTGSNGKTTTKEMIAQVLSLKYRVHKTQGNLNNHIGVPLTLLAMPQETELSVIEMGMNHLGEIARLCEIAPPDVGLITNIGKAHLEFLKNIDGVRRAKGEMFAALGGNDTAIINLDDQNVVLAAKERGVSKSLTYGFQAGAMIRGEQPWLDQFGCAQFKLFDKSVRVGVPGLHNASNALSALAVASYFDVDIDRAIVALSKPADVSGRMRRSEHAGRIVIDDSYNANPDSVRAALEFLAKLPVGGQRIAVLGDMLELGDQAMQAHGEVIAMGRAAQNIDHFIVHGPLFQQVCENNAAQNERIIFIEDKAEIARRLGEITQPGDVILVKGSRGLKMEEILVAFKATLQSSNFPVRE